MSNINIVDAVCEEEHGCEQQCDCIFSKEDIERMVALCDEEGYIVPRGLTREERRMFILNNVQKEEER